ncbi:MAG: hypothetical protein NTZ38_03495 [Candidatus Taylorbacteria bacterium]|nr:hypothetical protein [Candidatus Taylorbacteria bacterium]
MRYLIDTKETEVFARQVGKRFYFSGFMMDVHCTDGCERPFSIWPTPGWFYDGYRHHTRDCDIDSARETYNKFCLQEARKKPYKSRKDNLENRAVWLKLAKKGLIKLPAYMSVAIFFRKEPTPEMLKLLKERSGTFCKLNHITLTGFRLLRFELKIEEMARTYSTAKSMTFSPEERLQSMAMIHKALNGEPPSIGKKNHKRSFANLTPRRAWVAGAGKR